MTAENKQPATIDGATLRLLDPPRQIKLKTADDVRTEMASVYRQARRGDIDISDATKLTYMLGQLAKAVEVELIENRVKSLENILKGRKS